jgi:hypothetical protein
VRWVRIEGTALTTDQGGTVCSDVAGLVAAETDYCGRGRSVGYWSKVSAAIMKLMLVEEGDGGTAYSSSSSSKEGFSSTAVGLGGEGR